ncbi:unnamed protein product [Amoebophrya sp. A120]|nr:unnamed protein product [Amoebophrya sp. A120]|eukprot:GSA120T00021746001.1
MSSSAPSRGRALGGAPPQPAGCFPGKPTEKNVAKTTTSSVKSRQNSSAARTKTNTAQLHGAAVGASKANSAVTSLDARGTRPSSATRTTTGTGATSRARSCSNAILARGNPNRSAKMVLEELQEKDKMQDVEDDRSQPLLRRRSNSSGPVFSSSTPHRYTSKEKRKNAAAPTAATGGGAEVVARAGKMNVVRKPANSSCSSVAGSSQHSANPSPRGRVNNNNSNKGHAMLASKNPHSTSRAQSSSVNKRRCGQGARTPGAPPLRPPRIPEAVQPQPTVNSNSSTSRNLREGERTRCGTLTAAAGHNRPPSANIAAAAVSGATSSTRSIAKQNAKRAPSPRGTTARGSQHDQQPRKQNTLPPIRNRSGSKSCNHSKNVPEVDTKTNSHDQNPNPLSARKFSKTSIRADTLVQRTPAGSSHSQQLQHSSSFIGTPHGNSHSSHQHAAHNIPTPHSTSSAHLHRSGSAGPPSGGGHLSFQLQTPSYHGHLNITTPHQHHQVLATPGAVHGGNHQVTPHQNHGPNGTTFNGTTPDSGFVSRMLQRRTFSTGKLDGADDAGSGAFRGIRNREKGCIAGQGGGAGRADDDFMENNFVNISVVGKGNFSTVYRATHKLDGCEYAVKQLKTKLPEHWLDDVNTAANAASSLGQNNYTSSNMKKPSYKPPTHTAFREAQNLARALHNVESSHIVRYYGCWVQSRRLYLQTELCDCSLHDVVVEKRRLAVQTGDAAVTNAACFSEGEILEVAHATLSGLRAMHSNNLSHLDVKPENLLRSFSGIWKIADLGLACEFESNFQLSASGELVSFSSKLQKTSTVDEGDCRYVAKEALRGMVTDRCDIFSLGVTMYELGCGQEPPRAGEQWHALRDQQPTATTLSSEMPQLSTDLLNVLSTMLATEPSQRPNATDALYLVDHIKSADGGVPAEQEKEFWKREAMQLRQQLQGYLQQLAQHQQEQQHPDQSGTASTSVLLAGNQSQRGVAVEFYHEASSLLSSSNVPTTANLSSSIGASSTPASGQFIDLVSGGGSGSGLHQLCTSDNLSFDELGREPRNQNQMSSSDQRCSEQDVQMGFAEVSTTDADVTEDLSTLQLIDQLQTVSSGSCAGSSDADDPGGNTTTTLHLGHHGVLDHLEEEITPRVDFNSSQMRRRKTFFNSKNSSEVLGVPGDHHDGRGSRRIQDPPSTGGNSSSIHGRSDLRMLESSFAHPQTCSSLQPNRCGFDPRGEGEEEVMIGEGGGAPDESSLLVQEGGNTSGIDAESLIAVAAPPADVVEDQHMLTEAEGGEQCTTLQTGEVEEQATGAVFSQDADHPRTASDVNLIGEDRDARNVDEKGCSVPPPDGILGDGETAHEQEEQQPAAAAAPPALADELGLPPPPASPSPSSPSSLLSKSKKKSKFLQGLMQTNHHRPPPRRNLADMFEQNSTPVVSPDGAHDSGLKSCPSSSSSLKLHKGSFPLSGKGTSNHSNSGGGFLGASTSKRSSSLEKQDQVHLFRSTSRGQHRSNSKGSVCEEGDAVAEADVSSLLVDHNVSMEDEEPRQLLPPGRGSRGDGNQHEPAKASSAFGSARHYASGVFSQATPGASPASASSASASNKMLNQEVGSRDSQHQKARRDGGSVFSSGGGLQSQSAAAGTKNRINFSGDRIDHDMSNPSPPVFNRASPSRGFSGSGSCSGGKNNSGQLQAEKHHLHSRFSEPGGQQLQQSSFLPHVRVFDSSAATGGTTTSSSRSTARRTGGSSNANTTTSAGVPHPGSANPSPSVSPSTGSSSSSCAPSFKSCSPNQSPSPTGATPNAGNAEEFVITGQAMTLNPVQPTVSSPGAPRVFHSAGRVTKMAAGAPGASPSGSSSISSSAAGASAATLFDKSNIVEQTALVNNLPAVQTDDGSCMVLTGVDEVDQHGDAAAIVELSNAPGCGGTGTAGDDKKVLAQPVLATAAVLKNKSGASSAGASSASTSIKGTTTSSSTTTSAGAPAISTANTTTSTSTRTKVKKLASEKKIALDHCAYSGTTHTIANSSASSSAASSNRRLLSAKLKKSSGGGSSATSSNLRNQHLTASGTLQSKKQNVKVPSDKKKKLSKLQQNSIPTNTVNAFQRAVAEFHQDSSPSIASPVLYDNNGNQINLTLGGPHHGNNAGGVLLSSNTNCNSANSSSSGASSSENNRGAAIDLTNTSSSSKTSNAESSYNTTRSIEEITMSAKTDDEEVDSTHMISSAKDHRQRTIDDRTSPSLAGEDFEDCRSSSVGACGDPYLGKQGIIGDQNRDLDLMSPPLEQQQQHRQYQQQSSSNPKARSSTKLRRQMSYAEKRPSKRTKVDSPDEEDFSDAQEADSGLLLEGGGCSELREPGRVELVEQHEKAANSSSSSSGNTNYNSQPGGEDEVFSKSKPLPLSSGTSTQNCPRYHVSSPKRG